MPRHACWMLALALLTGCGSDSGTPAPPTQPPVNTTVTEVRFGASKITAEIAATFAAREKGLSGRTTLAADGGMLFVFGTDQVRTFWMKGTSVPLSIAFLDQNLTVLNISDMTPFDTVTIHRSASPARYALEVNRGWFAAKGITTGAVAQFTLPAGTIVDP
ncbi:MAG: DUF192 domain-containing protein [Gemmatimonadaceae bacterium]|nr:DUF192 domain-containing protein [Gemmatimonadaceae bacterium]